MHVENNILITILYAYSYDAAEQLENGFKMYLSFDMRYVFFQLFFSSDNAFGLESI